MITLPTDSFANVFAGLLLGTALGDALGLPAEGLSRQRIQRRWHGQWRHRFLFGCGMMSDDTEHTIFVAQCLLLYPSDPNSFQRALATRLRLWLLGLPAGVGLATLRAIIKLWLGFPPRRSGVWSAGNGPAMRSAILGAYFAKDPELRAAYVRASTRLTHSDPRAEIAARAVAEAAASTVNGAGKADAFLPTLRRQSADTEWLGILERMGRSLEGGMQTEEFATALGLEHGVSGYAYHSVPVALYAWLRHPGDYRAGLESALNCGGDTDTIGAIAGALIGAGVGPAGIPNDWLAGLMDWPRSKAFLLELSRRLTRQLSTGVPEGPVAYFWPGLLPRNLLFLAAVLAHGFRRILPPH